MEWVANDEQLEFRVAVRQSASQDINAVWLNTTSPYRPGRTARTFSVDPWHPIDDRHAFTKVPVNTAVTAVCASGLPICPPGSDTANLTFVARAIALTPFADLTQPFRTLAAAEALDAPERSAICAVFGRNRFLDFRL